MKRNVYFAYLDLEHKKTDIFEASTGLTETIDGFDIVKHINMSKDCDCYVSDLKIITHLFPGGDIYGAGYAKQNHKEPLSYKYHNCTFRSFLALCGMQNINTLLESLFPDCENMAFAMNLFLSQFGDAQNGVIKYTLAYQTSKMFYKDIDQELWNEHKKNRHYYYDLQTYQDMYAGRKAGTLIKRKRETQYYENMIAYDKKSAYPSVFVNDNMFPIGRIKRVGNNDPEFDLQWILYNISKNKWIKVVFDGEQEGLEKWYDEESDKTALEYWNLFACHRIGLWDFFEIAMRTAKYRLYNCNNTGYLCDAFRSKIVELYNIKETYPKNSAARFMAKTQLDMLFGKGLQRKDFRNISDVQNYYRGKGKRYLTPELSMHCIARLEYEIFDAYGKNKGVYCDTDGVKMSDTEVVRAYFATKNKEIVEKNRMAGFDDCTIGIWDCEGHIDRCIIFTAKSYITEQDGVLDCTLAGVPNSTKELVLGAINGDKIEAIRRHGFYYPFKEYYVGCGDVVIDYRRDEDGNIVFGHYRGDLEHE